MRVYISLIAESWSCSLSCTNLFSLKFIIAFYFSPSVSMYLSAIHTETLTCHCTSPADLFERIRQSRFHCLLGGRAPLSSWPTGPVRALFAPSPLSRAFPSRHFRSSLGLSALCWIHFLGSRSASVLVYSLPELPREQLTFSQRSACRDLIGMSLWAPLLVTLKNLLSFIFHWLYWGGWHRLIKLYRF